MEIFMDREAYHKYFNDYYYGPGPEHTVSATLNPQRPKPATRNPKP